MASLLALPNELVENVVAQLDAPSAAALCSTCRRFRHLRWLRLRVDGNEMLAWRDFYERMSARGADAGTSWEHRLQRVVEGIAFRRPQHLYLELCCETQLVLITDALTRVAPYLRTLGLHFYFPFGAPSHTAALAGLPPLLRLRDFELEFSRSDGPRAATRIVETVEAMLLAASWAPQLRAFRLGAELRGVQPAAIVTALTTAVTRDGTSQCALRNLTLQAMQLNRAACAALGHLVHLAPDLAVLTLNGPPATATWPVAERMDLDVFRTALLGRAVSSALDGVDGVDGVDDRNDRDDASDEGRHDEAAPEVAATEAVLADTPRVLPLRRLALAGCRLAAREASVLGALLALLRPTLEELSLASNPQLGQALPAVAAALDAPDVAAPGVAAPPLRLNLSGCNLTDAHCEAQIAPLLAGGVIRVLDISGNRVQQRGAQALAAGDAAGGYRLRWLHAAHNKFTARGINVLLDWLEAAPQLRLRLGERAFLASANLSRPPAVLQRLVDADLGRNRRSAEPGKTSDTAAAGAAMTDAEGADGSGRGRPDGRRGHGQRAPRPSRAAGRQAQRRIALLAPQMDVLDKGKQVLRWV